MHNMCIVYSVCVATISSNICWPTFFELRYLTPVKIKQTNKKSIKEMLGIILGTLLPFFVIAGHTDAGELIF